MSLNVLFPALGKHWIYNTQEDNIEECVEQSAADRAETIRIKISNNSQKLIS